MIANNPLIQRGTDIAVFWFNPNTSDAHCSISWHIETKLVSLKSHNSVVKKVSQRSNAERKDEKFHPLQKFA